MLAANVALGVTFPRHPDPEAPDPPSVELPLPPQLEAAVSASVRLYPRNGGLSRFELARRVAGSIDPADLPGLERCFGRWLFLARNGPPGFEMSIVQGEARRMFEDFVRKLKSVRCPVGDRWAAAVALAESVTLPPELTTPRLSRIAKLFAALSQVHDGWPFFVGFRRIGKATGIDHNTASRRVRAINGLGYVELVEAGNPGPHSDKANLYRWHAPPIPGGAPWNSKKNIIE